MLWHRARWSLGLSYLLTFNTIHSERTKDYSKCNFVHPFHFINWMAVLKSMYLRRQTIFFKILKSVWKLLISSIDSCENLSLISKNKQKILRETKNLVINRKTGPPSDGRPPKKNIFRCWWTNLISLYGRLVCSTRSRRLLRAISAGTGIAILWFLAGQYSS